MSKIHTKAGFWKCALQVNPFNYIKYRGGDHGMNEDQYNQGLLTAALDNEIKVIGLANHGNVDGLESIRSLMNKHDILVFPGFEIATTEKTHYVCLFEENTSKDQLNRYLGALGLTNPENGIWPSTLGGCDLLDHTERFGGFVYAAHATNHNGILRQKLVHVWQDPLLKAVQIPGCINDLKNGEDSSFYKILLNRNPEYKRDVPVGIINAKDVAVPGDLANPNASCLIKMTDPCFSAFKLAFQDPESRVRLNSDVSEKYYSRIESIKVTGGYLDKLHIQFSEHLNAVIGGRGTGKSTLLECLRFALQLRPIGKSALKQHEEIIKENLGKSAGRIELKIRSSKMNGRCFTIARRYGEHASVQDENGNPSTFTASDLLPEIEIYGQNEILEIAQDETSQCQLLSRFLESNQQNDELLIKTALGKLAENRKKLIDAQNNISLIEDELVRLPKLEEQAEQFKSLGLDDKLKAIPLLEAEKRLMSRVFEEELNLNKAFQAVRENLPDTVFLSESAISRLLHKGILNKIRQELDKLKAEAEKLLLQWREQAVAGKDGIGQLGNELNAAIRQEEEALEKTFKDIPACEGKSGRQIAVEYQNLMKEITQIRPKQVQLESYGKLFEELQSQRRKILMELSETRAERSASFARSLKKLNKRLEGKLRLTMKAESDRKPVIQYLLDCQLDNIAEGRLAWLKNAEQFSPVQLAELIRKGKDNLLHANWGITPNAAEALTKLQTEQLFKLEELELPDLINIELNVAHDGQENFKPLHKLSTGQQCTAILHLLLLQNLDPLIMDQPEDNLDNAFIADRIVTELRSAKIARQFIFATHNANIPVFGDAEWIGVLEASDDQALLPPEAQGAIDVERIRDMTAIILEGGKTAFNQRKTKYGF